MNTDETQPGVAGTKGLHFLKTSLSELICYEKRLFHHAAVTEVAAQWESQRMVRYQPPEEWQQWVKWLAAGLHGRSRWRLSLIFLGIVFARGRRTVTSWLRAVGISADFSDYYYFLQPLGRKSEALAQRLWMLLLVHLPAGTGAASGNGSRLLLAVGDTPTKRYGPHVQGAGIHHNPTPGPADQRFL